MIQYLYRMIWTKQTKHCGKKQRMEMYRHKMNWPINITMVKELSKTIQKLLYGYAKLREKEMY